MLLGCGSASHTRGALVLASSGGGGGRAASGARVCSDAGSERAARQRRRPGSGSWPGRAAGSGHGAAERRRRPRGAGAAAAAAAAERRVPNPAERAGEAAGALPRHLQLYQGVHHLRGLLLGAQDRAGRHQLPVSATPPVPAGRGAARPQPHTLSSFCEGRASGLRWGFVPGGRGGWRGRERQSLGTRTGPCPACQLHPTHLGEAGANADSWPAPGRVSGVGSWSVHLAFPGDSRAC